MNSKRAKKRRDIREQPAVPVASPPPEVPVADVPTTLFKYRWFLPVLLVAAAVLRLIALGRADLWQDEILMVMTAQPEQSLGEVWEKYWEGLIVSLAWLPLPALVLNAFMSWFSSSVEQITHQPFWVRLPGALLGTLGVWGMVLLTRRRLPEWSALAAVLMSAATFYPVFYAREVHAYPLLLTLTPFVLHFFANGLFAARPRIRDYAGFGILSILLAYTHLTAPMVVFAMVAMAGLTWLLRLKQGAPRPRQTQALVTAVAGGIAGLTILPVFVKILTEESPHLAQASAFSLFFMVHDVLSKLFLGDHLLPSIAAWVVFLAGLVGLIRSTEHRPEIRTFLGVLGIASALILFAASRSQYLSSRYFAVLAPLLFMVFGAGLATSGRALARGFLGSTSKATPVAYGLLGILLAVHLTLFLPPMYRQMNKSVDFGSIAGWLNDNLPPGTPYVMESAYELRYVSGYHPTPNLIPAVPFVHGSDPNDMQTLFDRQRDFLVRFPEAVFVQSVHQGYGKPEGVWAFPDTYFRHYVELRDNALRSLVQMGIYPTHFRSEFHDRSFTTRIHYNLPEDVVHYSLLRGEQARITFPGWQIAQVAQYAYARAVPGSRSDFVIQNLSDQPLTGNVMLEALVQTQTPDDRPMTSLRWGDQSFGPFPMVGFNLTRIESGVIEVPPGEHTMAWTSQGASRNQIQAMFVLNAFFVTQEAGEVPAHSD